MYKIPQVLDILPFKQCKKRLLEYAKINKIKTTLRRTGGREYIWTQEQINEFIEHRKATAIKKLIYKEQIC